MSPADIPAACPDDRIWHVYPVEDVVEHIRNRGGCWCRPTVEAESGGYIVIHNSFDGSELAEDDRPKPYV